MDDINQQISQQPIQQQNRYSMLKTISLGLGIIGIGSLIGIGGYFLGIKDSGNIIQDAAQQKVVVSSPALNLNREPTGSATTVNWKMYIDSKYNFSIKYPSLWTEKPPVSQTDNALVYIYPDESFGDDPDPIKYYIFIYPENKLPNVNLTKESIGTYTVYKTDQLPSRSGTLTAFITKDDKKYISISLTPYDVKQLFISQEKYVKIFNKILSTFKFTDQNKTDETANWKTLRNQNGFSIRYPSTLKILGVGMQVNEVNAPEIIISDNPNDRNSIPLLRINMYPKSLTDMKDKSLQAIAQADYDANKNNKYFISKMLTPLTSMNLKGQPAYVFTMYSNGFSGASSGWSSKEDTYKVVELEDGDKHYTIVFSENSLMNQILSTFKFTDQKLVSTSVPTPTPLPYQITQGNSINTYTNNVYNFSFNFPKPLFIYNSQSTNEYASFLERQGNINAIRMTVELFKNPNNLNLEEVEAKYNLKVNNNQAFDLEKTTISGKETMVVAGSKSMRELCNYDDDLKRRIVLAALIKSSGYVLIFSANNTCDTFKTDWFSPIVSSIEL